MSRSWYCAVACVQINSETRGNKVVNNVHTAVFPFAVTADSYEEAGIRAAVVLAAVKREKPGFDSYSLQVNKLGSGGLITDPYNISFT